MSGGAVAYRSIPLPGESTRTVRLLCGAVLVLVLLPIAVLVVMSFGTGDSLSFPPPGLDLRWYRAAWQMIASPDESGALSFGRVLAISLEVGILTAAGAVIAAVPAAYGLQRFRFRGRAMMEVFIALPVVFPAVVLGLSMLIVLDRLPVGLGIFRLVLAHLVLVLPFVVRNCAASLSGVGFDLEEAARTLGASPWRAFLGVVLPLMRGGMLAGAILAFVISFNEFTVTFFLYTTDVATVPIWLYSRTVASFDPTVFALATVIVLFDIALICGVQRLVGPDALGA